MFKNIKLLSPTMQLLFLFGVIVFGFFQYMFLQGIIVISWIPGIEEMSDEEVMNRVMGSNSGIAQTLLILQQVCFFLFPALFMNYLLRENGKGIFYWDKRLQPFIVPLTLMLVAVFSIPFLYFVNIQVIELFPNSEYFVSMDEERTKVIEQATSNDSSFLFLLNIIGIAILPAIGEEMIFRGFLIRNFYQNSNNIYFAVIGSSVLFALIHFQPLKILPMLALGLLLGLIYVYTRNLWVSIAGHFLNNILSLISTKYPILNLSENIYISSAASLLLILGIVYYLKGIRKIQME
ncbi:MAG: type II CAAX endopeptidase family protein [Crocinitomicaceae bacterium]